jgi:hypothetical protein
MLDDLMRSATDAGRSQLRGSNEGFFNTFLRRFKERLVFSLILTLVTLGIVAVVFIYVAFVVLKAL